MQERQQQGVGVWVLIIGMLATGTSNTLLTKLQDRQCVKDCDTDKPQLYEEPVWQTLIMFIGEVLCLFVYMIQSWSEKRNRRPSLSSSLLDKPAVGEIQKMQGWANLYMWIPTLCDICGTTLMNVGLVFLAPSIFQMLRGAVVIFTGVAAVLVLGQRHKAYRWTSLVLVAIGIGIVGASPVLFPATAPAGHEHTDRHADLAFYGLIMVLCAQFCAAGQFVAEEMIMHKYSIPALKAVGLEGLFGLITTLVAIPLLHVTLGQHDPHSPFNMYRGFHNTVDNPAVLYTGIGCIFSIAFFNFFGLSITKCVSSTSRSTIDTCRTMFIWLISLGLGWERFRLLQVVGFAVLIYGTFIFNDVIAPPKLSIFAGSPLHTTNATQTNGLGMSQASEVPTTVSEGAYGTLGGGAKSKKDADV
eukprot:GDKI01037403.1.p1 GENE.GDKI01037403.1~~GDKI01037403.1.p1  ORF type:complete len:414 (+),score=109.94 GDKI01037403.1:27-1268(+)